MTELLTLLLTFFIAFATSHYSLAQIWRNSVGCIVVAAVFAVLCVVFLGNLT